MCSAASVRARLTKCMGSMMGAGGTRSTMAPSFRRREDFSRETSEGMQLGSGSAKRTFSVQEVYM